MSRPPLPGTILVETLVGRPVRDAGGRRLGRVYDLEANRVGDDLCVTALLVGAGSWLTRFGWTKRQHGHRVPWERIISLSPDILVRGDD